MNLILVGLNHKTAPVEIRERLAFAEQAVPSALESLRSDYGFSEAMIVSTCNRVEILGRGCENGASPELLKAFLSRYHDLETLDLDPHLYLFRDRELVRHVFRVASSLDSMVPGESQILGQLKQAYAIALNTGLTGPLLSRLLPHAFFVAKRVRSETGVGISTVSISSVAVDLARKIFGDLDGQQILLMGAGKMSELAARSLLKNGAHRLLVTNRTSARAEEIAEKFGGASVPFDDLEKALAASDIVLVSTGASSFLLAPDLLERVIRKRRYAPLFLVDISVPRNVDPRVNDIENVFLYDIDDLQSVVMANLEVRTHEAELAEEIIDQEVLNFTQMVEQQNVGPLINSLRTRLEEICLEELTKQKGSLSDCEYEKVHRILVKTAHRIAHPVLREIKKAEDHPSKQIHKLELIRKVFDLKEEQ